MRLKHSKYNILNNSQNLTVPAINLNQQLTPATWPDETYDVMVDGVVKAGESLLEDFTPAVNPPAEIDDPTDSKPADWVDAATIPDHQMTQTGSREQPGAKEV